MSRRFFSGGGRVTGARAIPPDHSSSARSDATRRIQFDRRLARDLLFAWLHLTVLWSFAVAQPLYEILGDEPAFFVARENTNGDIIVLALCLTFLAPTLMAGVELLLSPIPRLRRTVHLIFVGALAAGVVLQVLSDASGSGRILVALAVAVGTGVAFTYRATRVVPSLLTALSPAPLVFLVAFLFFSPVEKLLFPESVDLSSAAARDGGRTEVPIVFIVFDEFFSGSLMDERHRIDASRYPHFAELAGRSTWYRNATTVAHATTEAVPAILTGQYPDSDKLPTASDHPGSLFTLLGQRYSMDVSEPATAICPRELCGDQADREPTWDRWRSLASDLTVVSLHSLLPEDLRSGLPDVDRTFGNFRNQGRDEPAGGGRAIPQEALRNRTARWTEFVEGLEPPQSTPRLHFLHSMLPHVPWQYLPTGKQYAVSGPEIPGLDDETWRNESTLVEGGLQRYLLQLGYVDTLIGELTERLRETGLYDRSLIVVTADHGVSFWPGRPRRQITAEHPADLAHVPLFVKVPNQREGRIDDGAVRTIDILPTVADYLGLKPGWKPDGRSFLDGAPSPRDAELRFEEHRFTFDTLSRARDATVRHTIRLFGAGDGGEGIFAFGRDRDLLGRRVANGANPRRPGVRVTLDQATILADLDPSLPVLPILISGQLTGSARPHERLAIVLNGRVSSVTSTYSEAGIVRFSAAVPPASLREGANSVELLAIEGSGGARRLVALGDVERSSFRLVEADGEDTIVASGGREIDVESEVARGYVDHVDLEDGRVDGWAVDPSAKRPADRILVFADDRLLVAGPTLRARPDIAEEFGATATRAGFQLALVDDGTFEAEELRVFAVIGDRASELPRAG